MKTRRDDTIMATKMQEAYDKAYREAIHQTDLSAVYLCLLFVGSALFGWFVLAPFVSYLLS